MNHQRVQQCKSCPWRVDCDPEQDIPNGYSCDLHEQLRKTIATDTRISRTLNIMACHYSPVGQEFPCANIGVRMAVMAGRLPVPEVDGEQHPTFDDTLPASARAWWRED